MKSDVRIILFIVSVISFMLMVFFEIIFDVPFHKQGRIGRLLPILLVLSIFLNLLTLFF